MAGQVGEVSAGIMGGMGVGLGIMPVLMGVMVVAGVRVGGIVVEVDGG